MSGRFTNVRRAFTALLGAALFFALATPAAAQHRARLSKDLATELAAPTRAALQVIVDGDSARVQRLAARYGLRVKKMLEAGAVLEGSANQLDAAAGDPELARMSLDAEVRGQMAVTREAIGADLAYGGFGRVPGVTGKNVVVAVIDSGVEQGHPGVKGHVIAAVDFTGTGEGDQFGHGTHLASVIAGNERGDNYGGVAPGAKIVSLKVLKADGSGRHERRDPRPQVGARQRQRATTSASSTCRSATPCSSRTRTTRSRRPCRRRSTPASSSWPRRATTARSRSTARTCPCMAASRRRATCRMSSPWARSTPRAPRSGPTMW